MNYRNPIHFIVQPAIGPGVNQHLRRRKVFSLPGGSALWLATSKVTLAIFIAVFGLNLWLGSSVTSVGKVIQTIEAKQHILRDEQMALLAERANLMSAKQIHKLAETKLALFVPAMGQIHRLR